MNSNWLKYLVALSALLIAGSAAYFSVTGLGVLFSGAAIAVMIMASTLEFAKLVTATYLKQKWNKLNNNEFVKGFNTQNAIVKWVKNIPKWAPSIQRLTPAERGQIVVWFNSGIPNVREIARIFSFQYGVITIRSSNGDNSTPLKFCSIINLN